MQTPPSPHPGFSVSFQRPLLVPFWRLEIGSEELCANKPREDTRAPGSLARVPLGACTTGARGARTRGPGHPGGRAEARLAVRGLVLPPGVRRPNRPPGGRAGARRRERAGRPRGSPPSLTARAWPRSAARVRCSPWGCGSAGARGGAGLPVLPGTVPGPRPRVGGAAGAKGPSGRPDAGSTLRRSAGGFAAAPRRREQSLSRGGPSAARGSGATPARGSRGSGLPSRVRSSAEGRRPDGPGSRTAREPHACPEEGRGRAAARAVPSGCPGASAARGLPLAVTAGTAPSGASEPREGRAGREARVLSLRERGRGPPGKQAPSY